MSRYACPSCERTVTIPDWVRLTHPPMCAHRGTRHNAKRPTYMTTTDEDQ